MKYFERDARNVALDTDAGTFSRYDFRSAQTGDEVNLTTDKGKYSLLKTEGDHALSGWRLDEEVVSLTIGDGKNILHRVVLDSGQEIMVSEEGEYIVRSLGKVAEIAVEMIGEYERD